MEKLLFIGTERGTSQKGNDYYLVHYGREIDNKKGVGFKLAKINKFIRINF